ncbi:hypothetical protein B0H14DRAFT_3892493 [Mycena olivaceomarginata]|nr:hypothetical protein B0H14DRAFT_3892493 [Mycena olivaceomarginata]
MHCIQRYVSFFVALTPFLPELTSRRDPAGPTTGSLAVGTFVPPHHYNATAQSSPRCFARSRRRPAPTSPQRCLRAPVSLRVTPPTRAHRLRRLPHVSLPHMSRAPPRLPTHATPATRHAPLPMPSPDLPVRARSHPISPPLFHARTPLPQRPLPVSAARVTHRPAPVYAWPACSTTIFSPRHARLSHNRCCPSNTRHGHLPFPAPRCPAAPFRIHLAPAPSRTPVPPLLRPPPARALPRPSCPASVSTRWSRSARHHRVPRIGSAHLSAPAPAPASASIFPYSAATTSRPRFFPQPHPRPLLCPYRSASTSPPRCARAHSFCATSAVPYPRTPRPLGTVSLHPTPHHLPFAAPLIRTIVRAIVRDHVTAHDISHRVHLTPPPRRFSLFAALQLLCSSSRSRTPPHRCLLSHLTCNPALGATTVLPSSTAPSRSLDTASPNPLVRAEFTMRRAITACSVPTLASTFHPRYVQAPANVSAAFLLSPPPFPLIYPFPNPFASLSRPSTSPAPPPHKLLRRRYLSPVVFYAARDDLQRINVPVNNDLSNMDKAYMVINYPGQTTDLTWSLAHALKVAGVDPQTTKAITAAAADKRYHACQDTFHRIPG